MAKKTSAPAPRPLRVPDEAPDSVRRVPTQQRSRERYSRILDAANQVFADVGYDAATTEQIAERAGTSIGSVYQFFPNKDALFQALSQLYFQRAQELFEDLLTRATVDRQWTDIVDEMIDAFWRFHIDLPGFRAVWVRQNISAQLIAEGDAENRKMADRAVELMAAFAPHVPRARSAAAASLVVETISALLFVAVRRPPAEAAKLVAELKVMVRGYLAEILTSRS